MSLLTRRLLPVLAVIVSLAGTPTAAVAAGVGLEPYFIEHGNTMSTTVGQSSASKIPFGVVVYGSGTATNVKLTVDLSGITGIVDVLGVSSPCTRSGNTITCSYGTVNITGPSRLTSTMTLRAKASAPASSGQVTLRLSSNPASQFPTKTGTVNVRPDSTDIAITSTTPTVSVGETVSLTFTVANLGGITEPWASIGAGDPQPGTKYVSGSGCTLSGTGFSCRFEDLAPGARRTASVAVKINGCDKTQGTVSAGGGWALAFDDPVLSNNDFQVLMKVRGCPGPTGAGSGGSGSGSGGTSGSGSSSRAASPTAAAAVSASPSPLAGPSAVQTPTLGDSPSPPPVAVEPAATDSGSAVVWLVLGAALLAAIGAAVAWRRRRTTGEVRG